MNRDSYNKIAQTWSSARNGFFGRERANLDALLENTPASSTFLDPGCGSGRPMTEYLIAQGHHVLGVDLSEELLAIARQNFPNQT